MLLNVGYDCGTQFILIYWSIIYVEKLGFNLSLVYTLFMCALILGSLLFNRISTFASSRSITILNTLCMISVLVLSGILENKYLLLSLFILIELLMWDDVKTDFLLLVMKQFMEKATSLPCFRQFHLLLKF